MELYKNQLKDYNWHIREEKKHRRNRYGIYVNKYCEDIVTLDIEVTSAWIQDGKVIGYHPGEEADYWNNLEPVAVPYIWMVSVNDRVFYGREFRDLIILFNDIPEELQIICWIHNLSYEFHFLDNILTWNSIFARAPHKPMKCISNEYPNITFRCTYYLTNMSLDAWGKELGVHKKTGDLDYLVVRTPLTELTQEEIDYCETDCLVVHAGIKKYIERYDTQENIPLTATGTVRRVIKEKLTSDPEYVKWIKKLCPKDADMYKLLQAVFAGGYTHANRVHAGQIIEGIIQHYDFASSYPTVMVCEKYPSTPWSLRAKKILPTDDDMERNAYILILKFTNIRSISFNTYIQASKCAGSKMKLDNGRVMSADELTITITEQDWFIIRENYKYDNVEVINSYVSVKKYLPKAFVEYVLQLYSEKTSYKGLKNTEERNYEDIYKISKAYINSLFGMTCTSVINADIGYNSDLKEWEIEPLTKDIVNTKLAALRHWNPREKRYFLNYSWGCWITAYARRNLWKCIKAYDYDVLYCDTDSIFIQCKADYSWYDNEIKYKLEKACIEQGIDYSLCYPKDKKGIEQHLGLFTREDDATEFITLGSKRYSLRNKKTGQLELTISGINKEAVELLNNDLNNFRDGFIFDKDAACVHKNLRTYIANMAECVFDDGYVNTFKSGINLRPTGYELGITDEYKTLIKYMDYDIMDMPESIINGMRGVFKNG